MNLVQSVFDLANSFVMSSVHVEIDEGVLKEVALIIKDKVSKPSTWPLPKIEYSRKEEEVINQIILHELIAGSINYKYWYGRHDIRPNQSSSVKMYELLAKAWSNVGYVSGVNQLQLNWLIDNFIGLLIEERMPMVEDRIRHLREIREGGINFVRGVVEDIRGGKEDVNKSIVTLIKMFPGYGSDMFLKRASLFFMQLYRMKGYFGSSISVLPIPADYQVPKMLRYLGVLEYSDSLWGKISSGELIASGSLEECEIRASTVIACSRIAEFAGVSSFMVDDYLWLNRKMCVDPFHLTITTDY